MKLEVHHVSVAVRSVKDLDTPNLDMLRDTVLDLVLANDDLDALVDALTCRLKPTEVVYLVGLLNDALERYA